MKHNTTVALFIVLLISPAHVIADTYRTFISGQLIDIENVDDPYISIIGQHFFDGRKSLGPLNEFAFIERISSVNAFLTDFDGDNSASIGGELYTGRFLINAGVGYNEFNDIQVDTQSIGAGFFFQPETVLRATVVRTDIENQDAETSTFFSLRHEVKLTGNDYLGFILDSDDEADSVSLSSRYFAAVNDRDYMVLGASVTRTNVLDVDTTWDLSGRYYFGARTGVGASVNENELWGINANHFFTQNFSLDAGIQFFRGDHTSTTIAARYQF